MAALSPGQTIQHHFKKNTHLLLAEKTRDLRSFFLMNSMILSSFLAVWARGTGEEGNRTCSILAWDTRQFNNLDVR